MAVWKFLSSFLTYVEDTWFNCYSMEDWNQFDNSTMEHLINNFCEGGNLRMKIEVKDYILECTDL